MASVTRTTVASVIRRLPESLANKIAAGEVVERPASVVKELVENSLDAGATRIEVRVEAGGRDLIEVVDDGAGMTADDALACLERHATSKLRTDADLFDIRTLGFRGEALPSIAAVSRFTLLTRPPEALEGTRVEVQGGRVLRHEATGAPAGTTVRVEDLFETVPARRKFLRRPETEIAHVNETVSRLALAHPEVGFSLTHRGKRTFSSPAGTSRLERVVAVLGRDARDQLHPWRDEKPGLRLEGLFSSPEYTRHTQSRGIHLFVNRRYVRDRQLSHAIVRAYGDLIDRRRSPVVVLFLEVAPDAVDVNVHPQKLEVRFADGRRVYDTILDSLARALAAAPWSGGAQQYALERSAGGVDHEAAYASHRERVLAALARFGGRTGSAPAWPGAREPGASTWRPAPGLPAEPTGTFGGLTVVGQVMASFIVCEGPRGLVLVDQHAAAERLEFERLRALWRTREIPSQALLVPLQLEVSEGEAAVLLGRSEELSAVGFDLSDLGGGSVAVRAVPAPLSGRDLAAMLRDLIDELMSVGEGAAVERALDRLLATIACHAVVRAGDPLSKAACESLLARMDGVPRNANCPHGRPVAFELELPEIERRFGRR